MSKGWKIIFYLILILAIIVVIWLMFGNTNPNIVISPETNNKTLTGEEITNTGNTTNYENTNTFEEDVIKDLEGFFNSNNGYEDVEGEFGFTNPENE